MRISDFLHELKKRNSPLYYFGWLNMALLVACLVLYFVDATIIAGINAWIKPVKFAISVAVYAWTYGWLLHYVNSSGHRSFISWTVIVCMLAENVIITWQAAQGEPSHYNISSALNAILFSTMGIFIGINTFINVYTAIIFFLPGRVTLANPFLLAWQLALLLFVVGGISGGLMIANMGHTIGAPDGGAGLPFTNWSTQAGDIRVAHFFTLHGLQVIPLFTTWVYKRTAKPTAMTITFFFLYVTFCIIMHLLALRGIPVIYL